MCGVDRLGAQDLITLWPDEVGWQQDIGVVAYLDCDALLRAVVPVSLHDQGNDGPRGNRPGQLITPLPVGMADCRIVRRMSR